MSKKPQAGQMWEKVEVWLGRTYSEIRIVIGVGREPLYGLRTCVTYQRLGDPEYSPFRFDEPSEWKRWASGAKCIYSPKLVKELRS